MAIVERLVEYQHGEVLLEGYLVWDDSQTAPAPAIAVAHAWGGRSDFECARARKLAQQGYTAMAIDVYGKGVFGNNPEENAALMEPLLRDRLLLQERLKSAISCLADQPESDPTRVAAIGYCFGGLCVLDLARIGSNLAGVVSLHGLFIPPKNQGGAISAKVLCLHGYDDPMATPDTMVQLADEMTRAGADWQIHAYGGTVHAFTNPAAASPADGVAYSEAADRRSWRALSDFLEEVMN
jgi:dienelactone hydrolase